MPETLYPLGYGRTMVTMDRLRAVHEPWCHPDFAGPGFAWIEAQEGRIGIGGGRRLVQPDKPGFAPAGKSFHQDQRFRSGIVAYSAWDLVVGVPGGLHRAPTWAEVPAQGSAWALAVGVHCNVNGEPWHMQRINIDGYDSWVRAGRPDPLPWRPAPPPTVPATSAIGVLVDSYLDHNGAVFGLDSEANIKQHIPDPAALRLQRALRSLAGLAPLPTHVADAALMRATGPVIGPIPAGHDAYGART